MSRRSPKKQRPNTGIQGEDDDYVADQLHHAQMVISQQEIEIERLKTTVVALNAKCSVVDDHKVDVNNHYNNHSNSEVKRQELHTVITTISTRVH